MQETSQKLRGKTVKNQAQTFFFPKKRVRQYNYFIRGSGHLLCFVERLANNIKNIHYVQQRRGKDIYLANVNVSERRFIRVWNLSALARAQPRGQASSAHIVNRH